ncbi:MAG: FAD-binding domain-containing protein [Pseudomonadota bacterium]
MTPEQATRDYGLRIVDAFKPRMGRRYANGRNYDRGAGRHRDVSVLSPYVRRRLVTEREVVAAALAEHGPENAEKFVQEVLWRGYFKGWLERRPGIWDSYRDGLDEDLATLQIDRRLRKEVEAAESGSTGLDCFDAWAEELVETGYLHNHARMWFASIWVFTFGLPWRIGADFFYRHLLDGDPASNTCSWRWVAGLHTRGKTYEAKAWNIAKFTENRFSPRDADLATGFDGLESDEPEGLPSVTPLRDVRAPEAGVPTALVITEDDCALEEHDLAALDIRAAVRLTASHLRSPREVSELVQGFDASALQDAAARAGVKSTEMRAGVPDDLAKWAEAAGAKQIAMPYVPTGPLADWMTEARPALDARGVAVTEWRREWDALVWPHATAGFFKVKKKIPEILHRSGLS